MKTAIFLIVSIVTLGAVGIVTAVNSANEAHADCCKSQPLPIREPCHGCEIGETGDTNSVGKCSHIG
jgi:hypothetical protein